MRPDAARLKLRRNSAVTVVADAPKPAWLPALTAILLVQTTCAFLTRLVPILAPLITRELGLSDSAIGYLSAMNMAGSIAFLVIGAPFIRRFGPLRTLQLGLALGLFGVAALVSPTFAAIAFASFLIGVGYAPSAPAGNEVLHRYAPPARRTLIFSIKQAGVPIGGVIAGLALPPIADAYGWRAALIFAALVTVLTIVLVQPMRDATDVFRDATVSVRLSSVFSLDNLKRPLRALWLTPALRSVALVGACFAVAQGIWLTFLVSMGVSALRLDFAAAGFVFAVMQATGIGGRILLGWFADLLGSGRQTLRIVAVTSSLSSLALAFASPAWPFGAICALAAVAGVTVSSWNGVQMAEIARLAPKGAIAEASSGATIVIFLGYIVGPLVFAWILAATGRYEIGFVVIAATTLLALIGLRRS
jgi:MFS family permease